MFNNDQSFRLSEKDTASKSTKNMWNKWKRQYIAPTLLWIQICRPYTLCSLKNKIVICYQIYKSTIHWTHITWIYTAIRQMDTWLVWHCAADRVWYKGGMHNVKTTPLLCRSRNLMQWIWREYRSNRGCNIHTYMFEWVQRKNMDKEHWTQRLYRSTQDSGNSTANALVLPSSCASPWIYNTAYMLIGFRLKHICLNRLLKATLHLDTNHHKRSDGLFPCIPVMWSRIISLKVFHRNSHSMEISCCPLANFDIVISTKYHVKHLHRLKIEICLLKISVDDFAAKSVQEDIGSM